MNVIHLIGNVASDPQSRTVQSGKTVCNFNVAVNRRGMKDKDGKDVADFFRISAWEKLGENCQKYLSKGKKVAVTGNVSVHAFHGNDGAPKASIEVFATDVEFLSARTEQSNDVQPSVAPADTDGELPF